jgi:hypothetical protein
MLARSVRLTATVLAVGVALGLTTPALAATTPTISAPAYGLGYGPIPITGTARAGATVTLIEAAYLFRGDMAPAKDYEHGDIPLVTTANSAGHYTFDRTLDSGFVFAVEADGLRSRTIGVALRLVPIMSLSSTASGTLSVDVAANLGQPGIPVHIQRAGSGGAWTTIDTGYTDGNGAYSATIGGQPVGSAETIRAYLEENVARPTGYADAPDDVWSNWTDAMTVVIGSTGTPTRVPATSTPAAPGGTSTTPPATTPPATTPPATTPPVGPKAGDVTFSRIQYDSPGRDTGSTASLNGEWFRLTNRTGRTVDLRGWTVKDAAGHTYTFGAVTIRGHKMTYVHTGRGTAGRPDSAHLYWGRTTYIWNNGGDTATLRGATGRAIDSCRYTGTAKGYTAC